ncbi:uncharacterized protein LOC134571066 [Pelobates fuscus]|uniref:uncharacterized protein LOC134571066 n=1 Tax=Pelobates fuscus TaxID=191477 RepID=UPI002FE456A9
MAHHKLREDIKNFSLEDCALGNQGYDRVLLQLFGYTGHGKSSFINSCKFVLDGEYRTIAEAGVTSHGGAMTMVRKAYKLTDAITMVDNRGCKDMNSFETLEVYSQLANFLPLNEEVKWKGDYDSLMERLENADLSPNYTDFIVPIFVYSVRNKISSQDQIELKNIIQACQRITGVYPIVVLTYKTSRDYFEFEKKFRCFGAEVVFAVENYTETDHVETRGRHTDILNILKNAVDDVKFQMEKERNPVQERIDRRIFLLKMIRNADVEDRVSKRTKEAEKSRKPKESDVNNAQEHTEGKKKIHSKRNNCKTS